MNLAIISVTNKGALLANSLAQRLGTKDKSVDVFAKNGRNPLQAISYDVLGTLVKDVFSQYDGLIFIMATGIVVRVIAPYVCDKRFDPAVVVMDDNGTNAISLLSGHIGGANELTMLIAQQTGANPVITTATDIAKKPAADMLAVKLGLTIEPFPKLRDINAGIVNGDVVKFFLDKTLCKQEEYCLEAAKQGIIFEDLSNIANIAYNYAVIITDQILPFAANCLYLRPPTLAVGIGCRRGTANAEILAAVTDACNQVGRSMSSIAIIGSSIVKQNEVGLLEIIEKFRVPSAFFVNDQLQECIETYRLEESSFVKKEIGVGNVCAAAAMLAGKTDRLLLPKTKYKNVTVAIALVK